MFQEGLITGLAVMVCLEIPKLQLSPHFDLLSGPDIDGLLCMAVQEKILHILLDSEEKKAAKSQGEAGFEGGVSL